MKHESNQLHVLGRIIFGYHLTQTTWTYYHLINEEPVVENADLLLEICVSIFCKKDCLVNYIIYVTNIVLMPI